MAKPKFTTEKPGIVTVNDLMRKKKLDAAEDGENPVPESEAGIEGRMDNVEKQIKSIKEVQKSFDTDLDTFDDRLSKLEAEVFSEPEGDGESDGESTNKVTKNTSKKDGK